MYHFRYRVQLLLQFGKTVHEKKKNMGGMGSQNPEVLPRANLTNSMSIFLNFGMPMEQIVDRVTANAARAIRRPELGNLNEGAVADITVLDVEEGKFGLLNATRSRLDARRPFRCVLTVRNGVIVWDSEGLSIPDASRAGPYSNFK